MRILIADDERLARFQLKSMLCEIEEEAPVIYEADNGKKLIEECRRHRPDVAFVDIAMPQTDGLSAIEACMQLCGDTQFVVVSGHSDFSFAKRAISLQVADYLLKPVEEESLRGLMKKLRDKLMHTRRGANMDFVIQVTQCLQRWEEISACEMPDPCAGQDGQYRCYRFFIDCATGEYGQTYLRLSEALQNLSEELAVQRTRSLVWEPKQAGLDFIVFCEKPEYIDSCLRGLCEGLASPTLIMTCLYSTGTTLWEMFSKMDGAGKQQLRFGAPGLLCSCDTLRFSPRAYAALLAADTIVMSFHEANGLRFEKAAAQLEEAGKSAVKELNMERFTRLLGVCLGEALIWSGELPALVRQLRGCKTRMYGAGTQTDKMRHVLDYVQRHYMEDISVVSLAGKMGLTPNYFSTVFHERMGQTFSSYVTSVRMEYAKQILCTRPEILVREVAVMVGYYSPRHFSSVFKKITGYFPSDYRESSLADTGDGMVKSESPPTGKEPV